MKKILYVCAFIMLLFSCKKDVEENCEDDIKNQNEILTDCGGICTPCQIEYPEYGFYFYNLLSGSDTIYTNYLEYSICSKTNEGSKFKIELELLTGEIWGVNSNVTNFQYDFFPINNTQTFEVPNYGKSEAVLYLNHNSSFLIKYFENSEVETKRKVIIVN